MPWASGQHLVVGRQVTESVLLVLHQTGVAVVEMETDCLTMNLTLCWGHWIADALVCPFVCD